MTDAERIWREKSDEDLLEAAAELDQFTRDGQEIIRAELKRRGLEDPLEQSGVDSEDAPKADAEEATLGCLRCHATLRYIQRSADGAPRWHWAGQHPPVYDPDGAIHMYACPQCGHVEMFMDLPEEDEETDQGQ